MPQDLMQINEGFVYLIVTIIGIIVWFSRLESKNSQNSKDISRLQDRQDAHDTKLSDLDTRVMKELSEIKVIVGNIEGRLSK